MENNDSLQIAVERKLMQFHDPKEMHNSLNYSQIQDLLHLHQHLGQQQFQSAFPWKQQGLKAAHTEGFLEFQRDVALQIDEIQQIVQKFYDRIIEGEELEEQIAEDLNNQESKCQQISSSLQSYVDYLASSHQEFEDLTQRSDKLYDDIRKLINIGREKVQLEEAVNQLEKELQSAQEDLQRAKDRGEMEVNARNQNTNNTLNRVQRLREELETFKNRSKAVSESYSTLEAEFQQEIQKNMEQLTKLEQEAQKYEKVYQAAYDELRTKEEVYESLKLRLEEASMGQDALKTAVELNQQELDKKIQKSRQTIVNLEQELQKVKQVWMQDVETMRLVRVERDSLQTQYNLLNQKWSRLSEENKNLREKVEEYQTQARINLEASNFTPSVTTGVRSATGSAPRVEIEYQRQLDLMQKHYETEIDKLNDELQWMRQRLESEKQWVTQLQETNTQLERQLDASRSIM